MALVSDDRSVHKEFDTGVFVANYFKVLAGWSVACMVSDIVFDHSFPRIDVSFIFFLWAAVLLKEHNPTARKWCLWILGACLIGFAGCFVALFFGQLHSIHVNLLGMYLKNPSVTQALIVLCILTAVLGMPFGILLSAKARRQFGKT